jgi:hypothetical protein
MQISSLATATQQQQEITNINELINDICLQLFTIDDESAKQEIIGQLLWKQCIPRTIQLSSEMIHRKAMKAMWYSLQAITLQLAPKTLSSNSEEKNLASFALSNIFNFKQMVGPSFSKLDVITRKYPQEQLQQISDSMFNSARDIILDPQMYAQIPFNETLVKTIFCMCLFLSSRGERDDELQLLVNAANVYLKNEVGKRSTILDNATSVERPYLLAQVQDVDRLSRIINGVGDGSRQILLINSHINNETQLRKFLKRFANIFFSQYTPLEKAKIFSVSGSGLKTLHSIVKKGLSDIETLQQVMNHCKMMITEEPYVTAQKIMPTFLGISILVIQISALEIVSRKLTQPNDMIRLRDIKREFAKFVNGQIVLFEQSLFAGNLVHTILSYVINIKIEEIDELCILSNNCTGDKNTELQSCLEYLRNYERLCCKLYKEIPSLSSLQWRLKTEMELIERHLSTKVAAADDSFTPWFI